MIEIESHNLAYLARVVNLRYSQPLPKKNKNNNNSCQGKQGVEGREEDT